MQLFLFILGSAFFSLLSPRAYAAAPQAQAGDYVASMTANGLVVTYRGAPLVSGSRLTLFKPGFEGAYFSASNFLGTGTAKLYAGENKLTVTDSLPELDGFLTHEAEVDAKGVTVTLRLRVGKVIAPSPIEYTAAMFPPEVFAGGKYQVVSALEDRDWQPLAREKPKETGPGTLLLSGDVFGLKLRGTGVELHAETVDGTRPNFYDMRSRDYGPQERAFWVLYQGSVTLGECVFRTRISAQTVAEQPAQKGTVGKVFIVQGKRRIAATTIAVGERAHSVEKAVARELQRYLSKMCGQELTVSESDSAALPKSGVLYVGQSEAARKAKLFTGRDFRDLGNDGFRIRVKGGNVLLAGGGHRGTAYAVYRLLENLGCRFYSTDLEVVPEKDALEITAPLNLTDKPTFEWRAMWGTVAPMKLELSPGEWEAKVGDVHLPKMMAIPPKGFWHHTMGFLLPADTVPQEWLAMFGGQRRKTDTAVQQYCLSNPGFQKRLTERVLQWMEEDPNPVYYPVHYGDVGNFCECDNCKKLYSEKGSVTDAVIWFLNQIAAEVKPKHPDKFLTILSYHGTRKPPVKELPADNLLIIFCAIVECQARPWSQPVNLKRNVTADLERWIAIHPLGPKGIITFEYPCTYHFAGYPYPALYAFAENLRYYKRLGLRGVYICGLTRGHLVNLYSYVMPHLLWNPDQDLGKLVEEFTQGWYGKAGKPMREYVELLHQSAMNSKSEGVMDCHAGPGQRFHREMYTPEYLDKTYGHFADAEGAAESEVLKRRILNEKWGLLFTDLFLNAQTGRDLVPDNSDQGFRTQAPREDTYPKMAELLRITQLLGRSWEVNYYTKYTLSAIIGFEPTASPWWSCPRVKELMENPTQAYQKEVQKSKDLAGRLLVTLENQHTKVVVVPGLGGRIWRLYAKGIGQDLLWRGSLPRHQLETGANPDGYLNLGGYEEYTGEKFGTPGWAEKYDCVLAPDKQSATLTHKFPNGLVLTRTIALLADRPGVGVDSELKNTSNQTVQGVVLRGHPQFCFRANAADLDLNVKQKDGNWSPLPFKSETWLTGNELPAGAWGVTDKAMGMSLVNEFDSSKARACFLYASPNKDFYNLEIFATTKDLAPGESARLRHRYVVSEVR
ncbi:MAG: DUF4838 domain-containing protein [Armatimonadetes bacterium]|nr:DUF4838 domain-containing protein [Armatimonadota bacterium]